MEFFDHQLDFYFRSILVINKRLIQHIIDKLTEILTNNWSILAKIGADEVLEIHRVLNHLLIDILELFLLLGAVIYLIETVIEFFKIIFFSEIIGFVPDFLIFG